MTLWMNLFMLFSFFFMPYFQDNTIVSSENSSITIKGEFLDDGYLYSYGFIRYLDTNETNGILIKTDVLTKQIIFQIQYDVGYDEMFLYLAEMSETEIAIVNKNTLTYSTTRMNEFVSTEVLLYDKDGFFITKKVIQEIPSAYGNVNYRLFLQCGDQPFYLDHDLTEVSQMVELTNQTNLTLQYQGQAYLNHLAIDEITLIEPGIYIMDIVDKLYSYHQMITIIPEIVGVLDGGVYTSSLSIRSNGDLYINGMNQLSPVEISEPGSYTLTVLGLNNYVFELTFLLDFTYEGIEEQEETSECIIVTSNAKQMSIDGLEYVGTLFCDVGKHELVLEGEGGYTKKVTFSILPKIDGVHNYEEFTEPITIFVHGEAYLNGTKMMDETLVSDTGNYLIEVMYDGEIYEQIFFTVRLPSIEEPIIRETKNYVYEIALGILVVVGIYMIIKKK
ncbi:MAG: hypothetical protein AB7U79_02910 [Candidatus Izemoplasmatales bacterium]